VTSCTYGIYDKDRSVTDITTAHATKCHNPKSKGDTCYSNDIPTAGAPE